MGFGHGEKSVRSEESVRPAAVIRAAAPHSRPLLLFPQYGSKPTTDKAVYHLEGKRICMLKVTKPSPQHRVEICDNGLDSHPLRTFGFGSDAIPQGLQTLTTYPSFPGFEAIPQKFKALTRYSTISHMGLVRVQGQTVCLDPGAYFGQGRLRCLTTCTHHDKVIGIADHMIPFLTHQTIERVQIQIRKQRTNDRPLRRSADRCPLRKIAYDILLQVSLNQFEYPPVTDSLLHLGQQIFMWYRIEVTGKIGIHHVGVTLLDQSIHVTKRVLAPSPRSKAIACFFELPFENRLDNHLQRCLHNAVLDYRYSQWTGLASRFGDLHPFDGLSSVGPGFQCLRKFPQILL